MLILLFGITWEIKINRKKRDISNLLNILMVSIQCKEKKKKPISDEMCNCFYAAYCFFTVVLLSGSNCFVRLPFSCVSSWVTEQLEHKFFQFTIPRNTSVNHIYLPLPHISVSWRSESPEESWHIGVSHLDLKTFNLFSVQLVFPNWKEIRLTFLLIWFFISTFLKSGVVSKGFLLRLSPFKSITFQEILSNHPQCQRKP